MAKELDGILVTSVGRKNTLETIGDDIILYFRGCGFDVSSQSRSAGEQGILVKLYRAAQDKNCGANRAQREIIQEYQYRHQDPASTSFNQLLAQYASTLSCGACFTCQLKKPYSGGAQ
jgi:hypothetical protein